MAHFHTAILAICLVVLFGICQCSDECFYHPGLSGTKCLNTANSRYTCCPPDHHCNNGECVSKNARTPSSDPSLYTAIIIGAGVTVFVLIAIIFGVVHRHRQQMATTGKSSLSFIVSPFFQPTTNSSRRNITSVGYRVRSTSAQASTGENSNVKVEVPTNNP